MAATTAQELTAPPAGRTRRVDAVTLLTCYALLLMLIPSPLVFEPLGAAGSPATMFAAGILVVYLVSWLHPRLAPAREPQPLRRVAICFGCAIIATYVSANRHAMPTLQLNGADRGLILIGGWLGILLIGADGIDSMERLKTLIRRLLMGATVMAALGAVQFYSGLNIAKYVVIPGLVTQHPFSDLATRDSFNRPAATALTPIGLAAVMAVCLPLAVHQARFSPPGRRLRAWFQVALIGSVLPMTVSRTAVVALVTACLVVLPTWSKRDRRLAYLAGAAAMVVMWVAIPGLIGTFRSLFDAVGSDSSTTSRTSAFQSAMPFVTQHPWLGRGFDTFFPLTYFFTDDQYLLSLIEIGAIGVVVLLALFVTGWSAARGARRANADPETRHLAQCLAAGVAVATVSFATFDALSFSIITGLTFMILGCAGAMWRLARDGPGAPAERLPSLR